ncbi:arginase family protein [Halosquirtibacter laminarini]|uniref:Arginase family protein n=1 Tax=Halosquirtibacter laminarini TaxID=3374600 RepID=A0AC61NIK7_9BACT|nr:arginase family protein [Prolixibacteraceae bacterium]
MDFLDLIEEVDFEVISSSSFMDGKLGRRIRRFTENSEVGVFSTGAVVLLSVLDLEEADQGRENYDTLRKSIYDLYDHFPSLTICDVGHVRSGRKMMDTYVAFNEVINSIMSQGAFPIVLGSQTSLFAPFLNREPQKGNVIWFDSRFPSLTNGEIKEWNYSMKRTDKKMLMVLGSQKYLNSLQKMDRFIADGGCHYGVGQIRDNIQALEPELRDATSVGIHIDVMKSIDTPGGVIPHPNGLTSTEMCQMMWYYGMGNRASMLSFWGYHVDFDPTFLGACSISQMLWHFLLGLEKRENDFFLEQEDESMEHFVVTLESYGVVLYFMKNKTSERWWFAVEYNNLRSDYVSCLEDDYKLSRKGEISDRLWRFIIHKRMCVAHTDDD